MAIRNRQRPPTTPRSATPQALLRPRPPARCRPSPSPVGFPPSVVCTRAGAGPVVNDHRGTGRPWEGPGGLGSGTAQRPSGAGQRWAKGGGGGGGPWRLLCRPGAFAGDRLGVLNPHSACRPGTIASSGGFGEREGVCCARRPPVQLSRIIGRVGKGSANVSLRGGDGTADLRRRCTTCTFVDLAAEAIEAPRTMQDAVWHHRLNQRLMRADSTPFPLPSPTLSGGLGGGSGTLRTVNSSRAHVTCNLTLS